MGFKNFINKEDTIIRLNKLLTRSSVVVKKDNWFVVSLDMPKKTFILDSIGLSKLKK